MTTEAPELTDKERLFVAEYLIDLNATQAARAAGFAKSSANVQGAGWYTGQRFGRLLIGTDVNSARLSPKSLSTISSVSAHTSASPRSGEPMAARSMSGTHEQSWSSSCALQGAFRLALQQAHENRGSRST
jgi:hypothetical protein